ncbi:MAG: glycerol-3-phosphate dehydrogenase [Woeseiaceae bacterium]
MTASSDVYDVAVVGAGINGAGIVRDAAMRGLKVVLLEKKDVCSGCSWISSRLIHGGLRYLEYGEIPLVYESLHERRNLRVIAPHLVKPLRISLPIYKGARRGPLLIRLGMIAYDLLSLGKKIPGHDMLDRDEILAEEPGVRAEGLRAAARYYDGQVTFAERLVLENLLAARSAGATIMTHSEVTAIRSEAVHTLSGTDTMSGASWQLQARVVINAAGPWVDEVEAAAGDEGSALIGGTKGSHIIVAPFCGAPQDAFYVEAHADGRPFFIIPWNGQYLIGTTDIRYDGDLDTIRASQPEVDYLLAETNRVFPDAGLGKDDIHYAYAGVRPLPRRERGPESAITRKHIIRVDKTAADGMLTIIGGKLTTYRNLAEQAVDRVGKLLRRKLPECRSADTLLPGAHGIDDAKQALQALEVLSEAGVERLLAVYGGRARLIAELSVQEPALLRTLDAGNRVLAAEVALAVREEFAVTLEDIVFRRLMVGLDADQGRPMYDEIAGIAALQLDWDAAKQAQQLTLLRAYSDSLRV